MVLIKYIIELIKWLKWKLSGKEENKHRIIKRKNRQKNNGKFWTRYYLNNELK